jgi:hypothetical protein
MKLSYLIKTLAVICALTVSGARAAAVSGGALTVNIDRDAFAAGVTLDNTPAPSIYVEEFFDATAAASRDLTQILEDNSPADWADYAANEIPATGLQFAVNGYSIVPNLSGRQNRATTLTFNPNDLRATVSGSIGLGGVIRFRVDAGRPNNRILMGDMTMEYHSELEGASPGRSGWLLVNHIGFDADAFELFDVTTSLIGNELTLNGNLGYGSGLDHLGASVARLNDTRIGYFSFQTTVVPVPAAVWLFAGGLAGLGGLARSKRKLMS